MSSTSDFYDLEENKVDKPDIVTENSYSSQAEETIKSAIWDGIVHGNLQSAYTRKITRKELCHLAVQTYMAKTGYIIPEGLQTPFTDVDDDYVTAAYTLNIAAGNLTLTAILQGRSRR